MTDKNFYEGGLTDEAFDRAEQAGRIHDLEERIASANDPAAAKAREIADLQRQLADATARQQGDRADADATEGEAIARQWNETNRRQ